MSMFKIGNAFLPGTRDLVAVDMNGDSLKLLYMKSIAGKKTLESLVTKSIIGMSDQDLAGALKTEINRLKLKSPEIISVVPTQTTITQNIEIPATDPREISNIVNLQAGRRTPYSREEMVFDHLEIGVYKHSYTKILLVIVPRKAVKRQYEIFSRAGLSLSRVVFAPESFGSAVAGAFKSETESSPLGIIHVDESSSDFSVFLKKKIIFTRPISIGCRNLLGEKDLYYGLFIEEIKKSVEVYMGEDIEKSPGGFIMAGAVEALSDLGGLLSEALSKEVRLSPQYKDVDVSDRTKGNADTRNVSFFNMAAVLSGYRELAIRLVPEEVKLKKAIEKRGQELVKTGAYVMVIMVMFLFVLANKIFFREDYLRVINEKYKDVCAGAGKLETEHSRVSLAKHYLKARRSVLDVITGIGGILPDNMELSSVRIDEDGKFSARGVSESMSSVFAFVDSLSKSEHFKDVQTRYTAQRKDRETGRNVTDFEIVAAVERGGA